MKKKNKKKEKASKSSSSDWVCYRCGKDPMGGCFMGVEGEPYEYLYAFCKPCSEIQRNEFYEKYPEMKKWNERCRSLFEKPR